MKLTSKGRYAVMAMADLAKMNAKQPTRLSEFSLWQGISISFLDGISGIWIVISLVSKIEISLTNFFLMHFLFLKNINPNQQIKKITYIIIRYKKEGAAMSSI